MLIAFQMLTAAFMQPVNDLVYLADRVQEAECSMDRIDDVLRCERDPELHRTDRAECSLSRVKLGGSVELRNVTFGYSRLSPPLFKDFNLKVQPGQRVALVGPTGCGKSTLVRLLTGLLQPWAGDVLLDGLPRHSIPRELYRDSVAAVDQEIFLFEGTCRDNIALWDQTTPEKNIIEAAKDACLHDDIAVRPGAYESLVEEGGRNFSGGQRQRLEIARALANNPTLLILDEATSALDPKIEAEIDRNLRRRGCTCLIIAHRLSTIRDCDQIVVLNRGQTVEQGTHEELMARPGLYAQLIEN
jgi:ABC-type bacteriocin/lantibiotic exporter with double-glycine peptidase domain